MELVQGHTVFSIKLCPYIIQEKQDFLTLAWVQFEPYAEPYLCITILLSCFSNECVGSVAGPKCVIRIVRHSSVVKVLYVVFCVVGMQGS